MWPVIWHTPSFDMSNHLTCPIIWNVGGEGNLFLPIYANCPTLLFSKLRAGNSKFFANFCQFLPMANLLFWNLRGGNGKVGINRHNRFPQMSNHLTCPIIWYIQSFEMSNRHNKSMDIGHSGPNRQTLVGKMNTCCWSCPVSTMESNFSDSWQEGVQCVKWLSNGHTTTLRMF